VMNNLVLRTKGLVFDNNIVGNLFKEHD
jgi:hypothetical protein